MAGNMKALRLRIRSVASTQQLTKAMGLVASSKIRSANAAMLRSREYAEALGKTVSFLSADPECRKSPFLKQSGTDRTRLIVVAGDRGLAGGYNANIFRLAADFPEAELLPIGKRACEKVGGEVNSSERFSYEDAAKMADELCTQFCSGAFDRLGILCTEYVSVIHQAARVVWLLPFSHGEHADASGTLYEPDRLTVLDKIAREYVAGMIFSLVRESFACEVTARRMAMDSAGKNAAEMIDRLTLSYNRARQGAITQEITEIVAGSGIES